MKGRCSHTAVAVGDCILVLGGVKAVSIKERKEKEEREMKHDKEPSSKDSATSESDILDRLPFQVKRINLANMWVLHTSTSPSQP